MSVKGDKVECAINNKVVATYDKSALVTASKLNSTDGIYGLRFAHNTEVMVTGLKVAVVTGSNHRSQERLGNIAC